MFSLATVVICTSKAEKSVYNKTLEYVKTFAKFDKPEAAAAIREYVPAACYRLHTYSTQPWRYLGLCVESLL